MSNLVQEIDQDLIKHMCALCDKSFSSGRSLGGHMRSHMIMVNSSPNHDHNGSSNSNDSVYELRKDPKKTSKVKDSSDQVEKLCKECGKGFQSWKALFGHMKCHSESRTSQSHNANSRVKGGRIKKSRSKNSRIRRYLAATTTATTITTASSSISLNDNSNQISSNHASTSIVSEIIQDHESEVALCLIMLSRDERKWGNEIESFDNMNSSDFLKLTKVEGKKPIENGPKVNEVENSQIGSGKFLEIVIQNDEFNDENESSFGKFEESNNRKFECFTCNKSFHSYQALGGHKTSHKKLKINLDSKTQIENAIENKPVFNYELMDHGFGSKPAESHHPRKSFNLGSNSLKKPLVLGSHKCRICSKVFSSGQALGGHKRSHMVAEAKLNQQKNMNRVEKVHEPANETRGFLDLNLLPDSMEEDMNI